MSVPDGFSPRGRLHFKNSVECDCLPFHDNEESDGHTDNYCYQ